MPDDRYEEGQIAILYALAHAQFRAADFLESYSRLLDFVSRNLAKPAPDPMAFDIARLLVAYTDLAQRHPEGLLEQNIAEATKGVRLELPVEKPLPPEA